MSYPLTRAEIEAKLDEIETILDAYLLQGPQKFAEMRAGSVTVNIPDYIRALKEEQKELRERLENFPYMIETDVEGTVDY